MKKEKHSGDGKEPPHRSCSLVNDASPGKRESEPHPDLETFSRWPAGSFRLAECPAEGRKVPKRRAR